MDIRRPRLSIRFLFTAVFSVAVIVVVDFAYDRNLTTRKPAFGCGQRQ